MIAKNENFDEHDQSDDQDRIDAKRLFVTEHGNGTTTVERIEMEDGLTAQDDRLALALSRGTKMIQAARYAGMSRRTAYRHLEKPAFRRLLARLRAEYLERNANLATAVTEEALQKLRQLVRESADEKTQLRAAQCLLTIGARLNEWHDQSVRIEQLERLLDEQQNFLEEYYAIMPETFPTRRTSTEADDGVETVSRGGNARRTGKEPAE